MAKLFSKEKDLFLRIVNSILVLVLIFSIIIALGTGINIIHKNDVSDYSTYSKEVCTLDKIPSEEINVEETKKNCYASYIEERKEKKSFDEKNIDNFLISISTIVIISLFLNILNKIK